MRRSRHGLLVPSISMKRSVIEALRRDLQKLLPLRRRFHDDTLGYCSDFFDRHNAELVRGEAVTSLGSCPPCEPEWCSSACLSAELVRGRSPTLACAAEMCHRPRPELRR
jgi:hypothetical protein